MTIARAAHPWNARFRWTDHSGPFTTVTDTQAKQYDEDGFFVFEDAFDAATLARIDEAIAPGEARVRTFLADRPDGRFGVAGIDTQTVAPGLVGAQRGAPRPVRVATARPACAAT